MIASANKNKGDGGDAPPPRDSDRSSPRSVESNETGAATPEREHGGPRGPEPTRYGDWERKGRCIDF